MTDAHSSPVTIRLIERWPAHEPRRSDPHYHAFYAAKRRMKKAGLLKCQVDSDYHAGQIELHHALVEFAHVNDIDVDKFNRLYGLTLSDDEFKNFVEGAPAVNSRGESLNALEPLCTLHHRGQEGVHSLPEPEWNVLRTAKDPQLVITALSNTEIPVQKPSSPSPTT